MTKIATVLSVVALAAAGVGFTRGGSSSQGAGLEQAAKQYVQDIAKQNSLKIDRQKVLAVRQDGDEGVVREEVTYHQYFQVAPGTKPIKGPEATITLAIHLHRSDWNAGYANS